MGDSIVTVTEGAVREFVRSALKANRPPILIEVKSEDPVNVNPVVDPQAAETDPNHPNYTPQSRAEFEVAVRDLVAAKTDEELADVFNVVKSTLDAHSEKETKDVKEKDVEETIRRQIRSILKEAPPHWGSYGSIDDTYAMGETEDDDEEQEEHRKNVTMTDVSGATFQDIADQLGFSVAGAKQAVDKALRKSQFIAGKETEFDGIKVPGIDEDDLEIMVLTAMNEYIDMLNSSDELSAADVRLMKDHPDIVRELDGFREFLDKHIHREIRSRKKSARGIKESPMRRRSRDQKPRDRGPECEHCGGDNTELNEPIPSMVGYGEDWSWTCKDCGETSHITPLGKATRPR